jgi:anti-anti-sigma regulatory factor
MSPPVFKEVSSIDDSGTGEVVAGYKATEKDGTLKLLNPPKFFNELLMITKFMTVFQTYDNEEEALNSFY